MRRETDVIVSPAVVGDAQSMAQVHVDSWREAYKDILPAELLASLSVIARATMWTNIIRQQSAQTWIAKQNDEVIGFVSFGISRDADAATNTFEIHAIYVHPNHWSTGAGCKLLLSALEQLTTNNVQLTTLWVLANNYRATRFYERFGFVPEQGVSKTISLGGIDVIEQRFFKLK